MRNGFEKEVAVYCMRLVKAASPHPQVGDERNATRTKAVAAAATSTTMATIWIPVPVRATLSKFPPGVSISGLVKLTHERSGRLASPVA